MGRAFEARRASKEKRWDKMSKLFPKFARAITMAAKEGGVDPDSNSKLRLAIAAAKAENMPKDNVKKAIERASGKDSADFAEVNYEGKAAHGILIWVECATDNNTRTFANIRIHFNKGGGTLLPAGALEFMFNRKTVIKFKKTKEINLEEVELELIDHGLEELEEIDGIVYLYGDFTSFGSLTKACEDMGIEIKKAATERIATDPIEVTEEQMAEVEALIDRLEDDEDVQDVFTNIA